MEKQKTITAPKSRTTQPRSTLNDKLTSSITYYRYRGNELADDLPTCGS